VGWIIGHSLAQSWGFPLLSRYKNLPNGAGDTSTGGRCGRIGSSLRDDFSSDPFQSGDHLIFRCNLCRLGDTEPERSLLRCCALGGGGSCWCRLVVVWLWWG